MAETEQITETCGATAGNDPWPCVLEHAHPGRHRDQNGDSWSYGHKYGRPEVYEITWTTGHVETVIAHQITWPDSSNVMFGAPSTARRIQMMAEIDERWTLTLSAFEDDIRTIRRITDGEAIPGGAS